MRKDDQGRRLCSAHTTAGKECRAPAVTGATVCRSHGAAKGTPGREAADRVTLNSLVAPALLRLVDVIEDPETPPAAAVAAIRLVLDKTNYGEPLSPDRAAEIIDRYIRDSFAEMSPEALAEYEAENGPVESRYRPAG